MVSETVALDCTECVVIHIDKTWIDKYGLTHQVVMSAVKQAIRDLMKEQTNATP